MSETTLNQVQQIVAVASGKGGVGKSTVSVNLALALAAEGKSVGLLDADIYGPSQGLLMGIAEGTRPDVEDNLLLPVEAHGIKVMSMSFVTNDRTPAVWRGPMASGALQQLLLQTNWGALDYLIVDMPPGTGDIQLTLSQAVPLAGAVIVTTPQPIALMDARKGIEMFRKVEVPVLGIVENMSYFICGDCGHREAVFGEGGGAAIAAEYDTRLLGQLPLSGKLRQQSDSGEPPVISDPEGESAQTFLGIAAQVSSGLANLRDNQGTGAPIIRIVED